MKKLMLVLLLLFITSTVSAKTTLPTRNYKTKRDAEVLSTVASIDAKWKNYKYETKLENYTNACLFLYKEFSNMRRAYRLRGEMYPMDSKIQQLKDLVCYRMGELQSETRGLEE